MKPTELFSKFKEGFVYPLYYFYSEDQYFLNLAIRCVETAGGFKVDDALAYDIYYAGSTPLVTILESARSLPFLGSKKLVLVREVEKLPAADHKRLLAYCQKPGKKSTVVLAERLGKKGGRQVKKASFGKKLLDAVKEQGLAIWPDLALGEDQRMTAQVDDLHREAQLLQLVGDELGGAAGVCGVLAL